MHLAVGPGECFSVRPGASFSFWGGGGGDSTVRFSFLSRCVKVIVFMHAITINNADLFDFHK